MDRATFFQVFHAIFEKEPKFRVDVYQNGRCLVTKSNTVLLDANVRDSAEAAIEVVIEVMDGDLTAALYNLRTYGKYGAATDRRPYEGH